MKQLTDWAILTLYFVYVWLALLITLFISRFSIDSFETIFTIVFSIGASVLCFFLVFNVTILFISKRNWKMPDKNSFYNPLSKNVELHLGSSGNIRSALLVINRARELKMNVYFVSDHIDSESLIKIANKYGFKIEIRKATFVQKLMYIPKTKFYKVLKKAKSRNYECIECKILIREDKIVKKENFKGVIRNF
ncbi:hypothetical protein [Brevibacillus sp. VP]|uniref:hypothetical protein n=1 Tax=unclassified Brevibacillus TaxID=2684853 RepID=UPI000E2EB9D7|nr:hypothetical protein [Brevibacillus sp. VP]RFB28721.1 hypothetical protein DZB91_21185 [Brevibacillus sp. VP]